MERNKIIILFFLLLAFLFFFSSDVKAASSARPFYTYESLKEFNVSSSSERTFFLNIGSDGNCYINGLQASFYASGSDFITFDTGSLAGTSLVTSYANSDYFVLECTPFFSYSFFDSENNGNLTNLVFLKPYVIVRGVKYYLNNNTYNSIKVSQPSNDWVNFDFGAEVTINRSYNLGSINSPNNGGTVDLRTLHFNISTNVACHLYGYRYVSTGESYIADSVKSSGLSIVDSLSKIYSRFDITLSSFRDSLQGYIETLQANMISKFDELKQALTRDYDSSGAEASNSELSDSLDSINTAEGTAMTDAKVDVGNYDTASVFNFAPAVISSLSLITTFANSFFRASGDLTTALTVLFALVFISAVVGFLRFVK